jgi:hypothetical protein
MRSVPVTVPTPPGHCMLAADETFAAVAGVTVGADPVAVAPPRSYTLLGRVDGALPVFEADFPALLHPAKARTKANEQPATTLTVTTSMTRSVEPRFPHQP